ncbi:Imidazolonepropionase [Amycolatopsis pretoriensis]|uniref:Imidazolonepropionase n=1 Tax=Amycolatopsis pretoriensis TaxID=218821 RepID=A0A1H5RIE7_9PSEU|nr:amidohydrolase family protein [Amycolatopsis pretoriensis]SEF38070.1 Imidazolonepropionase [Amycolatopsis pretoriensis]
MTVVVEGGKFVAIAPSTEFVPEQETRIVEDLAGRFVIPGLIDSHQHIATPPNRAYAEALLRRQVYGGVTLIRSMADDLRQVGELGRATLVGEIAGPDIVYAALMAGPEFFADPRTIAVSQGEVPGSVPWMQAITPETDLRLAVAMARGTGARAIKLYADLSAAMVAAIVAEAHRQGVHVWAHTAVFPAMPHDVVATGVDVVSHVGMFVYAGSAHGPTGYAEKKPVGAAELEGEFDPGIEALIGEMRNRGTILDATATLYQRRDEVRDGDDGRPSEAVFAARLVRQAHQAGIEISTGTDYETDLTDPFPALHRELEFLVHECGLTPAEVLRSATLVGARAAGADDSRGLIEVGKIADFVVLASDPLEDVRNLRTVQATIKRGCRYDRNDLSLGS